MTHGEPETVAARLTDLIEPFGSVGPQDRWMPQGFDQLDEAELHKATRLLNKDDCTRLREWWFAIFRGGRQTGPSFDIASTCTMTVANQRRPGILLVEAEAHDEELLSERNGKALGPDASETSQRNHAHIAGCIAEACEGLNRCTELSWRLSHEHHYQMSNRFASAWKLASVGLPVILIYLGFTDSEEMSDCGKPFKCLDDWERLVRGHSAEFVPDAAWNRGWSVWGGAVIPLIRVCSQALSLPGS